MATSRRRSSSRSSNFLKSKEDVFALLAPPGHNSKPADSVRPGAKAPSSDYNPYDSDDKRSEDDEKSEADKAQDSMKHMYSMAGESAKEGAVASAKEKDVQNSSRQTKDAKAGSKKEDYNQKRLKADAADAKRKADSESSREETTLGSATLDLGPAATPNVPESVRAEDPSREREEQSSKEPAVDSNANSTWAQSAENKVNDSKQEITDNKEVELNEPLAPESLFTLESKGIEAPDASASIEVNPIEYSLDSASLSPFSESEQVRTSPESLSAPERREQGPLESIDNNESENKVVESESAAQPLKAEVVAQPSTADAEILERDNRLEDLGLSTSLRISRDSQEAAGSGRVEDYNEREVSSKIEQGEAQSRSSQAERETESNELASQSSSLRQDTIEPELKLADSRSTEHLNEAVPTSLQDVDNVAEANAAFNSTPERNAGQAPQPEESPGRQEPESVRAEPVERAEVIADKESSEQSPKAKHVSAADNVEIIPASERAPDVEPVRESEQVQELTRTPVEPSVKVEPVSAEQSVSAESPRALDSPSPAIASSEVTEAAAPSRSSLEERPLTDIDATNEVPKALPIEGMVKPNEEPVQRSAEPQTAPVPESSRQSESTLTASPEEVTPKAEPVTAPPSVSLDALSSEPAKSTSEPVANSQAPHSTEAASKAIDPKEPEALTSSVAPSTVSAEHAPTPPAQREATLTSDLRPEPTPELTPAAPSVNDKIEPVASQTASHSAEPSAPQSTSQPTISFDSLNAETVRSSSEQAQSHTQSVDASRATDSRPTVHAPNEVNEATSESANEASREASENARQPSLMDRISADISAARDAADTPNEPSLQEQQPAPAPVETTVRTTTVESNSNTAPLESLEVKASQDLRDVSEPAPQQEQSERTVVTETTTVIKESQPEAKTPESNQAEPVAKPAELVQAQSVEQSPSVESKSLDSTPAASNELASDAATPDRGTISFNDAVGQHLLAKGFDNQIKNNGDRIAEHVASALESREPAQTWVVFHKEGNSIATLTTDESLSTVAKPGDTPIKADTLEQIKENGLDATGVSLLRASVPQGPDRISDLEIAQSVGVKEMTTMTTSQQAVSAAQVVTSSSRAAPIGGAPSTNVMNNEAAAVQAQSPSSSNPLSALAANREMQSKGMDKDMGRDNGIEMQREFKSKSNHSN